MEYNINFTYKDNKQLKEIYKELLKRNGMTMTEASQLLGLSTPQQLNNKFNNKKVSLSDLKDFLSIMGYDYEIIIKKRSGSFWVLPDLFYYAIFETLEVFTFSLPYFFWISSKKELNKKSVHMAPADYDMIYLQDINIVGRCLFWLITN